MKEWSEIEQLLVDYVRARKSISRGCGAEFYRLVDHGQKLLADAEPEIMSAEMMLRRFEQLLPAISEARMSVLRTEFLDNIAAVLDKKLADAAFDEPSAWPARRIVAETLRVSS